MNTPTQPATTTTSSSSSNGATTTSEPSATTTSLAQAAQRVEEIERRLDMLQREVLWPYCEPVERIRVTDQRAFDVQDIIAALREASFGKHLYVASEFCTMEKVLPGRQGAACARQAHCLTSHYMCTSSTSSSTSAHCVPRRCVAPTLPVSATTLAQQTRRRALVQQLQLQQQQASPSVQRGGPMSALLLAQVVQDGEVQELVHMAHAMHTGDCTGVSDTRHEVDYAACLRALAQIARHMHPGPVRSATVLVREHEEGSESHVVSADVQQTTQRQLYAAIVHRLWLLKQAHWQAQHSSCLHNRTQTTTASSSSARNASTSYDVWPMQQEADVVLALLAAPCTPRESLASLRLLLDVFATHAAMREGEQGAACLSYVLGELQGMTRAEVHGKQSSGKASSTAQPVAIAAAAAAQQIQSCLPWLLYYMLTHTLPAQPPRLALHVHVPYETQSMWVNGAANTLCAASWATLSTSEDDDDDEAVVHSCTTQGTTPLALHMVHAHSLPSFAPYWRLTLTTMLNSALDSLDSLAAQQQEQEQHHHANDTCDNVSDVAAQESHVVGTFISLRRVLCSLARHQRLRPIAELYAYVTGYTQCEGTHIDMERVAQWHTDIVSGAYVCACRGHHRRRLRSALLLWREHVLFEAYTLITLGHVAEQARDVGHCEENNNADTKTAGCKSSEQQQQQQREEAALRTTVVALLRHLQEQCLAHLQVLTYATSTTTATEDDTQKQRAALRTVMQRSLAGRVRDGLLRRLHEALRLSIKALYHLGEMSAITAFYRAHAQGSLCGTNWEAAAAWLQSNEPHEALRVLVAFLRETRQRFLASGLPQATRELLLRVVRATGQHCLTPCMTHNNITTTISSNISTSNSSVKESTAAVTPSEAERTAAAQLMEDYAALRQHGWCLAPALLFDAQLDGLLAHTHTNNIDDEHRAVGVRVMCAVLQRYVVQYSETDGLLTQTVGRLVEAIVGVVQEGPPQQKKKQPRNTTAHGSANTTKAAKTKESEALALRTLVQLLVACPQLPIVRLGLTRFAAAHYAAGTEAILGALCGTTSSADDRAYRFSEVYVQATLGTLPARTLKALQQQQHNSNSNRSDASRSREVIQQALCAALVRVEQDDDDALVHHREPWRCVLCHSWNRRQTSHCHLCRTLAMALVRCKLCGTFSTTLHTHCPLCRTTFVLPEAMKDIAGNIHTPRTDSTNEGSHNNEGKGGGGRGGRDDEDAGNVTVYPLRAWRCSYCQYRNRPTQAFCCFACQRLRPTLTSAPYVRKGETQKRSEELSLLSNHEVQPVRCTCCGQVNKMPLLRPWCRVCGSWQGRCTSTTPGTQEKTNVASLLSLPPAHATLWYCVECHHFNPWLLDACAQCHSMHAEQTHIQVLQQEHEEGDETVERCYSVPWQTLRCPTCEAQNALSSRVCYRCNEPLALPHAVQQKLLRDRAAWLATVFITHTPPSDITTESAINKKVEQTAIDATPDVPRCVTCHAALTHAAAACCEEDKSVQGCCCCCCPVCYAVQPGYTLYLWVCLHAGCLTVNHTYMKTSNTTVSSSSSHSSDDEKGAVDIGHEEGEEEEEGKAEVQLQCSTCGHRTTWWQLAEVNEQQQQHEVKQEDTHKLSSESAAGDACWEGLQLPAMASGQTRRCSVCHGFLAPQNVARICPRCGHCGADQTTTTATDRSLSVLELRLLLHELHTRLGELCYEDEKARRWCLCFAESAVRVLRQAAPHYTLFWQYAHSGDEEGRNEGREEDSKAHCTALAQLRAVIEALCDIAGKAQVSQQRQPQAHEDARTQTRAGMRHTVSSVSSSDDDAGTFYTSKPWLVQVPWLRLALRLVELANRSTPYDELGFATLRKLCGRIRPDATTEMVQETRWAYLRNMKLTREMMVGSAVCPYCLTCHAKSKQAQCALDEEKVKEKEKEEKGEAAVASH